MRLHMRTKNCYLYRDIFLKCFTSNTLLRKWYNSTINKKILVDSSITGCKLHLNKTIYSPFSLKIPISGLHAILIV